MPSSQAVRVLVVDDHPSVREGLRHFLDAAEDLVVVGEAGSAGDAVLVGRGAAPDVVLLDLVLPGVAGPPAVRLVVEGLPSAQVLVLSGTASPQGVVDCFRAGASGYLEKTAGTAAIREAIHDVFAGRRVVDPSLVGSLLDDTTVALTPRELEVLDAVSHGLTNRQVATRLGSSEHTVKTHLARAMAKLGAEDRTHAVATGMRRGMLR